MHGQLGRGDRHACGALPFERGADSSGAAVTRLDAAVRSYSTWRNSACLNEYGDSVTRCLPRHRGATSHSCSRASCVADIANPGGVPLERRRDRIDAELDAANGCRREHRALFVVELGDVVLDDRRQILGNGDFRDLLGRDVVASPCAARALISRHDGRDEQRQSIGALVQRAHERFVGGDRRRSLRHVVGDLALGERIEHDLLAQVVQAQLAPQRG